MESDMNEHLARTPRLLKLESFVNSRGREVASLSDAVKSSEHLRWGGKARKRRALRSYTRKQHGRTDLSEDPSRIRLSGSRLKRLRKRKAEALQQSIDASCCKIPFTDSGDGKTHGEGPRLLETYRWHVKRYKIVERWNHRLPVHFNGKGHASMGFLEKIPKGCVAHDASYWCAFHLDGAATDIVTGLKTVSSPSCISTWLLDTNNSLEGPVERVVPIHKRNCWPKHLIAPAKILWVAKGSTANLSNRLLIWVHCSAFKEAMDEMVGCYQACKLQCKVEAAPSLRRIEICGLRSGEVLKKVLVEAEGSTKAWMQALENVDELHDGQAFTLFARDPRLARPLKMEGAGKPNQDTTDEGEGPCGSTAKENGAWTDFNKSLGEMAFPQPHSTNHVSQFRKALTRCSMGLASDSIKRKLHEGSSGQKVKTKCYVTPMVVVFRKVFGVPCWSLLLPSGWTLPFWKEIMISGAFAAGLWEWRWLMGKLGLFTFPFDFPDSQAYMQTQVELNEVQNMERAKRAKSKRQPPCSFPPPWANVTSGKSQEIKGHDEISKDDRGLEQNKYEDINSSDNKRVSEEVEASPRCLGDAVIVEYCRDESNLASCGGKRFLPFKVEMVGKGVCDEGASIFEVLSGSQDSGVGTLLGFVTTSFPRGVKPFPGGFAICQVGDTRGIKMLVWVKNPKSTKLRKACLELQVRNHWNNVIM